MNILAAWYGRSYRSTLESLNKPNRRLLPLGKGLLEYQEQYMEQGEDREVYLQGKINVFDLTN